MTQSANPLRQYFRQPAIYLKLPTGGAHWPEGSIDIPANGELPILPMTAIDEITYRTPDALFNGQAVVDVIQSCVPSIKNAWAAPAPDINALLTAIRIASYGHDLEINSTCPACTVQAEYGIDLRSVLDQLKSPDFTVPIISGDLEIRFHPVDYKSQNDANQSQFDQQKMMQMLPTSDLDDKEKLRRMQEVLQRITDLTVETIKWSISSIRTPTAFVTEPDFFREFLTNCDRELFSRIREHVIGLRNTSELKPLSLKCTECAHEYQQTLTLDMTSFFAPAS
jgi:hypothetical protein